MVDAPKRRGRPPKARPVEIVSGEAEQPATVVKPVEEPRENTNPVPIQVEERDAATGALIALHDDPGEPVEFPDVHKEVPVAGSAEHDADVSEANLPRLSPETERALDRDFDGQAGGSRPKASLTDLQRKAFARDAVDAYQGQWEIKRTDGFNRVWTFRHDIVKSQDHMLIRVDRGPTFAERLIPASAFAIDSAERADAAIRDIDQVTER